MLYAYIFGSTLLVSLLSLVGVVTLSFKKEVLKKSLFLLISLSAGALFGDVFFHLLPELSHEAGAFTREHGLAVLSGIVLFFVLEKFIIWHHCHGVETPEDHHSGQHAHHYSLGKMNLLGDGLHNLIDGMVIGASYMVSIPVGIATTIAVILHEIPQEIGDFGVLIHSGYTVKKALFLNLLFSLFAVVGAVISVFVGAESELYLQLLIPVVSGGFLYLAGSDLIPELKKQTSMKESLLHLFVLVFGMALMYGLVFVEPAGLHDELHQDDHVGELHEDGDHLEDEHAEDLVLDLSH